MKDTYKRSKLRERKKNARMSQLAQENKFVDTLIQRAFQVRKTKLPLAELIFSKTFHERYGMLVDQNLTSLPTAFADISPFLRVFLASSNPENKTSDRLIMFQGLWFGWQDNAPISENSERMRNALRYTVLSGYTSSPEKFVRDEVTLVLQQLRAA